MLCPLSGLGESGTITTGRSLRSRLLLRSGTAGANPDKLPLLPKVCPAKRVVQTVPAEEVVVDVLPFPNSSYSFSAVIWARVGWGWKLGNDWVSFRRKEDADSPMSSSFKVFKPESTWNDV